MDGGTSIAVTSTKHKSCCLRILSTHKLLFATALAVTLGIILGVIMRQVHLGPDGILWLKIWGELFLRMLKLVMLPLVISCLVTGISSLQGHAGGRAGLFTLIYVFGTQLISTVMAAIFSVLIKPGTRWQTAETSSQNLTDTAENTTQHTNPQQVYNSDIIADFFRNLFPDNIIRTCIQFTETERQFNEDGQNSTTVTFKLMYKDGTNMLGVIVCCVAVGFAISASGKEGQPLLNVFKSLCRVMVVIMDVVIWYSPVAIASLVASAIVGIQDLSMALSSIALYVTTFLVCAVLHEFVLLPLIYLIVVRKNPFIYYFNILDGILAVCGSTSGIVALPIFMNACKNKLKLDGRVVDFVLPLLISINRNGSAMFVIVSLCFIANSSAFIFGAGDVVAMCLLTCLMASTVPPVPSGSVLILITVASSLNIPIDNHLAIILALEWILDRVRSTNNLAGSGYGCAVVEKICLRNSKSISAAAVDQEATATPLSACVHNECEMSVL